MTHAGLLIVQTLVVGRTTPSHYEIHLAPDAQAKPVVVLTRNPALYQIALDLEGTDQRVTVTYHATQRATGHWGHRLDRLEIP